MSTSAPIATVLLVEDEAMLRMVAAETMRDAGYVVYEAADGVTALQLLKDHSDIGLLFTDVKMPGMNGYQLALASLSLKPRVKILLMTGYASDPVPQEIAKACVPILRKPFDMDVLPQIASELQNRP